MQFVGGLGCVVDLGFGAEAGGGQDVEGSDGVVLDWADEIFGPLFDLSAVGIHPVEMRLQVAIGAGDVSDADGEIDVAGIVGPARADFFAFVVGDAAGLGGVWY